LVGPPESPTGRRHFTAWLQSAGQGLQVMVSSAPVGPPTSLRMQRQKLAPDDHLIEGSEVSAAFATGCRHCTPQSQSGSPGNLPWASDARMWQWSLAPVDHLSMGSVVSGTAPATGRMQPGALCALLGPATSPCTRWHHIRAANREGNVLTAGTANDVSPSDLGRGAPSREASGCGASTPPVGSRSPERTRHFSLTPPSPLPLPPLEPRLQRWPCTCYDHRAAPSGSPLRRTMSTPVLDTKAHTRTAVDACWDGACWHAGASAGGPDGGSRGAAEAASAEEGGTATPAKSPLVRSALAQAVGLSPVKVLPSVGGTSGPTTPPGACTWRRSAGIEARGALRCQLCTRHC